MGKREMERLNQTLTSHLSNIHETLQMLDQALASSLQKVSWDEVIKIGEQLSKNATTAGMLFTGEKLEPKAREENMEAYFNTLQGFLLLAYGSTMDAGPTLSSSIHASIKQVVDCSFMLWRECVSSCGSHNEEQTSTIPQLVGAVWDACSALRKTPATNIVAIGRAMTQVAVSVKDVLREMKELKPCSSDPPNDVDDDDNNDDDDDDFGKDLSSEEMKIAQLAIGIVSEAVVVIKELIRSITGLLKKENLREGNNVVEYLEKLLKLCCGIGVQIDELGACLYPPQELSAIAAACKEMYNLTDEVSKELDSLNGSTEAFSEGCRALKNALEIMKSEVSDSIYANAIPQNSGTADVVEQLQNLGVQN